MTLAGRAVLVLVIASTAAGVVVSHPHHGLVRVGLMVLGYGGLAGLLAIHRARAFLTPRIVVRSVLALLVVCVLTGPQGSHDVWAYVMYGRTVSAHGASPYRNDPDDVGHDPLLARVDPRWREQPSVYGPAFVVIAAAVTTISGTSAAAGRVEFQLIAAALALACVVMVGRATGDPAAMAWLGLNPLLMLFVVNPAHNDLLVGAPVLAAVLVAPKRPALAGALMGLASLVKIVGLVALAGLTLAVGRRWGRRAGWSAVVAGGAVVVAGYACAGGVAALLPLRTAAQWHISSSIAGALLAVDHRFDAVLACEVAAAVAIGVRLLRRVSDPGWLVAAVLTLYLLAAAWVLPWYMAWVLPVGALLYRSRLGLVVAALSAALCLASVNNTAIRPLAVHDTLVGFSQWLLPALEAAALVALAITNWLQTTDLHGLDEAASAQQDNDPARR